MPHRIPEGHPVSEISAANSRWPAPWSIKVNLGTNRATIHDRNGVQIISGLNIEKARVIIGAVNRDDRSTQQTAP